MGHTRQPRPLILRFPRPVTVFPGSTFECYSSYPTTPGLFYEVPDKKPVHLLDLPGKTLQKTHYGNITGGVICNLHMGEHRDSPEKIPDDPQLATVRIRIKNKSEEPESVGVLLLYPPLLDFSVLDNRLCLNIVELSLLSSEEGDIKHLKRPSLDGATLVESRLEEASRSNALDLFRSVMGFRTMESGF